MIVETGKVYKDWTHAGLRCKVIGGPFKNFNGYVAVPKSNVAYDKHYDILPINVHGGLTFGSQGGQKGNEGKWENSDLWWFGFDTAHSGDMIFYRDGQPSEPSGHYWTLEEVAKETEDMAEQFSKLTLHAIIQQKLRWEPDWLQRNITIKRNAK